MAGAHLSGAQLWQRFNCRLCGSAELVKVFELPDTPAANAFAATKATAQALPKYPLAVNYCNSCHHSQLTHVVDPEELFSGYAYMTGANPVLKGHFTALARTLVERLPNMPTVLELGSNDGTFLQAVKERGAYVVGVEPGKYLAGLSRDKGIPTFNDFFTADTAEKVTREHGVVDAWVATNVFAHIDQLGETLLALRHCSGPNTIGCVEVQSLDVLLEQGLFDMVYHEHLDYHWWLPFAKGVIPAGWGMTAVENIPTHGGSLRFWLKPTSEEAPSIVVGGLPLAMNQSVRWRDLGAKVEASARRLKEKLAPFHRVACFGAPAKLTTLLYGLRLTDESVLDYVVDDAPSKQGRFTPGMGLPIYPTTVLKDAAFTPDAILITAWNYAADIRAKLVAAGLGHIPTIVPFGEP